MPLQDFLANYLHRVVFRAEPVGGEFLSRQLLLKLFDDAVSPLRQQGTIAEGGIDPELCHLSIKRAGTENVLISVLLRIELNVVPRIEDSEVGGADVDFDTPRAAERQHHTLPLWSVLVVAEGRLSVQTAAFVPVEVGMVGPVEFANPAHVPDQARSNCVLANELVQLRDFLSQPYGDE